MDIIKVAKNSLQASLEKAVFEINSCLSRPQEKGALEDFNKAIHSYTILSGQIGTLNKLQEQIEEQELVQEDEKQD